MGIAQAGVDEPSLAGDEKEEYIWAQEVIEEVASSYGQCCATSSCIYRLYR
jgi:hypothetical protein